MQLVLELLKKIFVALQGVYTKAETDAALATEAQAREALDAKIEANTANDNALANVVKWQSYAAAMQRVVDEATAAKIAEEFERATNEYLADPTATKEWASTPNVAEGTVTSTNPFYKTPSTRPIVDFSLTVLKGQTYFGVSGAFSNQQNVPVFAPRVTNIEAVFAYTRMNSPVFFCAAQKAYFSFTGATLFSQPVYLPSCTNAQGAFTNTKMSAENISATLDSLPTWTDGKSHVITFTGSPGASELTQESPSVAAAVAKGWTVEL